MASNLLDSEITYESMVKKAAYELYTLFSTKGNNVPAGSAFNSRTDYLTDKIIEEDQRNITIKQTTENEYILPTQAELEKDIKNFMIALDIFKTSEYSNRPTNQKFLAFMLALNNFFGKCVIKAVSKVSGSAPTYFYYYKYPLPTECITFSNITFADDIATKTRIDDIYDVLSKSDMTAGNTRGLGVKSSISSSSCSSSSSSSCSSCSCSSSSSWFIGFMKI